MQTHCGRSLIMVEELASEAASTHHMNSLHSSCQLMTEATQVMMNYATQSK